MFQSMPRWLCVKENVKWKCQIHAYTTLTAKQIGGVSRISDVSRSGLVLFIVCTHHTVSFVLAVCGLVILCLVSPPPSLYDSLMVVAFSFHVFVASYFLPRTISRLQTHKHRIAQNNTSLKKAYLSHRTHYGSHTHKHNSIILYE